MGKSSGKTSIAKKKENSKRVRLMKGRSKGRHDREIKKKVKIENMYVDKMKEINEKVQKAKELKEMRKANKKQQNIGESAGEDQVKLQVESDGQMKIQKEEEKEAIESESNEDMS